MAYELTIDDLRPDTIVRVGLPAAGPVRRSYRLLISQVTPLPTDGLVRLYGRRLTLTGRPIEEITIEVLPGDLRPDQMLPTAPR